MVAGSRIDATPAPDTLAAIWERHRASMLERIGLIERAIAALTAGQLGEAQCAEARRAAHTLAGSVGTFGFVRASRVAGELELALGHPAAAQAPSLSALLATVRTELRSEVARPVRFPPAEPTDEQPRVLLVDDDRELCAWIAAEAASLEIDCETAFSPTEARAVCAERPPTIVLLDLSFPPDGMADAYELMSELTAMSPPIPVLVLTVSGAFTDRVEVARRGGRGFLPKSMLPSEVLDAVVQFLARERLQATRVLIVDDEPAAVAAMRALLEPHEIAVSTLTEPLRFWETLEEVAPELLILDVDMPAVNGPELCRVVRNDPRWSGIAVIFVTAHKDPATIEGLFRAGADDCLTKPIVDTELITRVSNRLERIRLQRREADTDSLTGLASRRKSTEGLAQLLSLADRYSQPVSVAMLDLDHFKRVNDTHGHAAGDAALRGVGERLRRDFRGDDVVGRWGGEEFIIGMYGMTRNDGVQRINETLECLRKEEFGVAPDAFTVSFSAGVAEYPCDGRDLGAVVNAADEALYRAKEAGRSRVVAVGEPAMTGRR
jgi:diguanylate cyclase (GGDEF)-like protein